MCSSSTVTLAPCSNPSISRPLASFGCHCPVETISPEDAPPEKWDPFVRINAAYAEGMDTVNTLVDQYATEHNVQNQPLE